MREARRQRPIWIAALVALVALVVLVVVVAGPALALAAPALTTTRTTTSLAAAARTGSIVGLAGAPPAAGASASVPVADVRVIATATNGTAYATTTAADGWYDLEQLPAGAYSLTAVAPASSPGSATAPRRATVRATGVASVNLRLPAPVATVTGVVRVAQQGPVPGIPVSLSATGGSACSTAPACGAEVASGVKGRYTLHLPAGTYSLQASDAGSPTPAATIVARAGATVHAGIALPAAAVPAGTTPHGAARDLRRLDAERAAAHLPAGLTLSHRWSAECAAHDAYERLNGVLSPTETAGSPGASAGGAWAGLNSDLAEGRWTGGSNPWEDAPIHLLALLAPSVKVVGIDDDGGFQCVTAFPGMVRPAIASDRIFTYPAAGATGVDPSETARESPFVPGQFVGIPNAHPTGRELFVYLDLAHQIGQAPVHVLAARLQTGGRPVALRRVDTTTPTVGRYLAGAILIPVKPLRAHARYTATVRVQDRSGTLTRRWSFQTR
jgi:hypothetical protein